MSINYHMVHEIEVESYRVGDSEIEVGSYYRVGESDCVIISILNSNKECRIVDLSEFKEKNVYVHQLTKIVDETKMLAANVRYNSYLDKTSLLETNHSKLSDQLSSEIHEFILETHTDKTVESKGNTAKNCNVNCRCVFCIMLVVIIGLVFLYIVGPPQLKSYFKMFAIFGGIAIFVLLIFWAICFCFFNASVGRHHQNKIVFNEKKKLIYWFWNNKLHHKIRYNKFIRVGYKEYHYERELWANVYLMTTKQKPMQFNWYLVDLTDATDFTQTVNHFWAEKENVDIIDTMPYFKQNHRIIGVR